MIVVSNSSPLIALAKIDAFDLLRRLYGNLVIPSVVYEEVVAAGAGLAGSLETAQAEWIEVRNIRNPASFVAAQIQFGLGAGELSTMILGREISADLLILDDLGARKLARREGFRVQGSIAVLEASFRKGHLKDLRKAYEKLLRSGIYLDRQLLTASLESFGLPAL